MKENRRDFLKKTGGCALGMASLATQMHHLGTMSALAQKVIDSQPEGGENYKALVLLYWSGGNDTNNLVVPIHDDANISNYAAYTSSRAAQGLALPRTGADALLPINVPRLGNLQYGLHPSLGTITGGTNPGIKELYDQGKLAIVCNVGTLARPLTKDQYRNSAFKKPYQLFSHSDQTNQAFTSVSSTQAFTGWGGRLSDRLTQPQNPNGLIPMVTSIAGAQLFTAGQITLPLAINDSNTPLNSVLNPAGLAGTVPTTVARLTAFNALRTQDLSNDYIRAASRVTDQAMLANSALQVSQDTTVTFPNTGIGRQLRQVARLVKKRLDLDVNRQVFYVQIGGFDTHSGQLAGQNNLYGQFSQAMRAFYDEMTTQGVQNDVTTFTLSDFGRTMNPAGSGMNVGSDHAWGSHMFVMGGAVAGGNFYGSLRPDNLGGNYYPTLTLGGPDDTDTGTAPRGRWIPTTSVDQYAMRMARWFGLSPADELSVFPNYGEFTQHDQLYSQLGFLP